MHEPVWLNEPAFLLLDLAVIQAVAIQPEPQAGLVLDAEIIPRQHFAARAPPLHRNALGTFNAPHRVSRAPPLKPGRRSIRYFRDHLDRFRLLEQPQRPQRRVALHASPPGPLRSRRPMVLRRRRPYRAHGGLGDWRTGTATR